MTDEELKAFAAEVRAECDAELTKLAQVNRDALPPHMQVAYDARVREWQELRARVDPDAIDLHVDAALHADRELTQAEAKALVRKQ